jgi:hypothetical protein
MFDLMVAVLPPLLSAQPPEVPRRAGLGDRFHYFRGVSGRRTLFSVVPRNGIGDFHSAVIALARRLPDGQLALYWISAIDHAGRLRNGPVPPLARDTVVLVHLLSQTDAERAALVADFAPEPALAFAA